MFTVCVYKNNEYKYLKNCIRYEEDEVIVTRIKEDNKEKVFEDFRLSKSGTVYYKPVSREELTDIYKYYFIVEYDAHLVKELEEKEFISGQYGYESITSKSILITSLNVCSKDDGWSNVDRGMDVKMVEYTELDGARLRLVFQKKDGVEYDPPLVVEKRIEPEEIYKYNKYYEEL